MKIIDAQVHIWSQTVTPPTRQAPQGDEGHRRGMLKEMDEAGVDAALIHPPYSWDPELAGQWRWPPPGNIPTATP